MNTKRMVQIVTVICLMIFFFSLSSCGTDPYLSTDTAASEYSTETVKPIILGESKDNLSTPIPTDLPPTDEPTIAPAPELVLQWSLKIGDLKFLAPLSDGTIHGFSPSTHAVISPNGELIKTEKIDTLSECVSDIRIVGVGAVEERYYTRQDDTVILDGVEEPCLVRFGQTLTIEKLGEGTLFPYADDLSQVIQINRPELPDGFSSGIGGMIYTDYDEIKSRHNTENNKYAFPNHNGTYSIIQFPEDLDLSRYNNNERTMHIFYSRFLWDDFILYYPSYDAIGNSTGDKTVLYKAEGDVLPLNSKPMLIEDGGIITTSFKFQEIYAEENGEFLVRYGRDLVPSAKYRFPEGMPKYSKYPISIGNDHAIYDIIPNIRDENILYKWIIVGDPEVSMPNP